jgi:2-polyprenyl-3-methyl-5-hydroxy-6-metoxy-1,4-benzoquinol methylase
MTFRNRVKESLGRSPSSGRPGADALEALRDTWGQYPSDWKQDSGLNLGYDTLGEEWGGPAFADHIVELVADYLGPQADVLELGCGGGKFSQRLAPKCRSLLCTDISAEMIAHTRESLSAQGLAGNVSYQVLGGRDFKGVRDQSVDFIFSYDVLLHVQPQNVFSYLLDARRVLRDGGVFMLHQINMASDGGMAHFLGQYNGETWTRAFDDLRRRGHIYFMSGDQMQALANYAGFSVARMVADEPEFRGVTGGRDLIGLLRMEVSRLQRANAATLQLLKRADDPTVYAVLDGKRVPILSAVQFERAGLGWDQIREVDAGELAAIPQGEPLGPWE